ncbi:hypothetical protein Patl1_11737 [Pistacia atlantica]|uniref:Uncharacterized protein n=1 Tax=Pistacia atlantica TaxID=434234 RepID=A0ACC1A3Z1_9ROSI|nr:hypothetical protein Patl1_11737 [Pistacia atlantica]
MLMRGTVSMWVLPMGVELRLPYHVVTDYEAEEDDRTLDSDTTGHKAILELRAEIETREKAGREAHEATASAFGSQGNNIGDDMGEQEQGVNPYEMMNGQGSNTQRDEKEPSEDYLNDEETENGETSMQDEWREVGNFDLNSKLIHENS